MRNIFAAMFIVFLLVALVFRAIGGSFDTNFWLSFLPGLMENLVALAAAVFIIDRIRENQRLTKLEQTNAAEAQGVLFLSNRLAFQLLEHLALASKEEFGKDPEMNFGFALDRFKGINLAELFYKNLMESNNREKFTEDFEKTLSDGTESISKALDSVYPRPDPTIKQDAVGMNSSAGFLSGLKFLITSFRTVNEQLDASKQMKPEHLDLLIKIGYPPIGSGLQDTQKVIVKLSEKAKNNQLFVSFD
jgi:hypothetical protein